VDANLEMGRVLGRLAELEAELRGRAGHPLLGAPSLHAATIQGGTTWSTYSAECVLRVERRLLPGETAQEALREMEEVARPHAARLVFARPPCETRPAGELARLAMEVLRLERGEEPAITGQTPWFDAALLAGAGIETVILGHGGAGAHEAEEWAELGSVKTLERALQAIAVRWCG
jgi:acetylornithine deacetylase